MGSSRPNTSTGPTGISPSSVQALRRRLEDAENAIKRLQANRTPAPLLVHQLSNTGPMSQVQDGQGLFYNAATGQYEPGIPHNFVLGNVVADPTQEFTIFCEGGGGYETQVIINSGVAGGGSGQSIVDFFAFAPGPPAQVAELSIGQGAPSIGRFFADSLFFGSAVLPPASSPPVGAGVLGFFGSGGATQQTATTLPQVISALQAYGLLA